MNLILVADDDRTIRRNLVRLLESEGYRTLEAPDGDAALALVRSESPDAVLLDLKMPGRDGLGVLAELGPSLGELPVIVVTAYADVSKVKAALNGGAAHLLEKPFRAAELLAALEGVAARAADPAPALFEEAGLTDKEKLVARHLLAGLSSKEIADREVLAAKPGS